MKDNDLSPEERKIAAAIAGLPYRTPPRDLSARIMARITPHPPLWRRALVWLLTPRPLRVAPVWPASALAATAIILVLAAGMLPRDHDALPSQTAASAPTKRIVRVEFSIRVDSATEVALIGSFNNWQAQGYRLNPSGREGVWTVSVPLPRGRHEYAFVLDKTRIVPDPEALLHQDDGFGNINSIIVVDEHAPQQL